MQARILNLFLGEDFNFSAILDDYQIIKELGQGGFGKVVLGKHKENKQEVAIKFMDVSEICKQNILFLTHKVQSAHSSQNIYKEAESLKKLVHKNIIQLYHAFVEGKQLVMIMECAAGGELYKWVEENGRISEIETRRIIQQVINAMHYCHIRGIVHRDLKLENVLFKQTGDLTIKVVDFGIAGVCDANKKDKVDAGSIAYMPPEVRSSLYFPLLLNTNLTLIFSPLNQIVRPLQLQTSGQSE